ncbi:hypothetical protein DNHGIG_24010 [Collibacillus ludicampi]|uniref:DUF1284 domain-containing protein n=2 Tax=Collibacillus ludicampi TaxID=2771369 RepID=A0AAV4LGC2_9BACL|nr:DUF1284 domain-containing protein [Collibacillus ludicampi]GIM46852.1 hypothetical protein DNHGIG_24010 [Collibacillus ludicampi]
MQRILRGHHILCVHGFQGMGYSPEFVKNMTEIVEEIRNNQMNFPIQVISGLDDVCDKCPNKGDGFCKAFDDHVKELDQRIMEHIGLTHGDLFDKAKLLRLTAEKVEPDDLDVLCAGCSWLSYGVCKEGIKKLKKEYKEKASQEEEQS